jgi:5-methylcytosine-specific restriction endonuclease McrA
VLVHGAGRCDKHLRQAKQDQQLRRGTAAQRGYGYRWQKASKIFLANNPLCVYCQRDGRITAATTVDHCIPHRGDPDLFWDQDNWQSLCTKCHNSRKQSEERRGGGG